MQNDKMLMKLNSKKLEELKSNRKYLEQVMLEGAQKAKRLADRKLAKVYKKVGLVKV